jgi:hypothetical protein
MSEQLSLHMFTYRRRVADGCGGHHAQVPEFAGHPIWQWVCCADYPCRA